MVDKISEAMEKLRLGPDKNMSISEFMYLMRTELMGTEDKRENVKPAESKITD